MKYRHPSRFRRVAKWVGLGLCVAILCLWAVSSWFIISYQAGSGFPNGLLHGRVIFGLPIRGGGSFRMTPRSDFPLLVSTWWDRIGLDWPVSMGRAWEIPLWMPFAAVAIPTAVLWRRDRRPPRKGHCPHCGYNLKGNESGVCPECSTPVPKQETTA